MAITSVITGDIIKSRQQKASGLWLTVLKSSLSKLGSEGKDWEIYRGDSFQIEIKDLSKTLQSCLYIKACLKTIKNLDVRLAIGIGSKTYNADTVSESNGEAFLFSGNTLEGLKKENQNLQIKTTDINFDEEFNLYFKLATITMDHWTVNSAEIVKLTLEQPDALQKELATQLNINQDAVSKRQKRAHLDAILDLNTMYQRKINKFS